MPSDLAFKNYETGMLRLTDKSFVYTAQRPEPVPSVPVKPWMAPSDEPAPRMPEIGLLLGLAVFMFLFLKIALLLRCVGVVREDETIHYQVKTAPRFATPCPSCRFFSGNAYLKCAVRPTDALTDRAIHCTDYSLRSPARSHPSTTCSKQTRNN
jgi:hypothetical protein